MQSVGCGADATTRPHAQTGLDGSGKYDADSKMQVKYSHRSNAARQTWYRVQALLMSQQ